MKLKTLKPHYYGTKFRKVGEVYIADIVHSEIVIRRGICKEVAMPTRKQKVEAKKRKTKK